VDALKAIDEDVRATDLPYEEWEVLNRGIAQTDRAILAMATGVMKSPAELIEGDERVAAARILPKAISPSPRERTLLRASKVAAVLLAAWLGRRMPEGREVLSAGTVASMASAAARS
jgi:hypothetical protein